MTRRAIAYIRVSTERQASEGVSLDAQRARIEAWCVVAGYTLAEVFVDAGLSGKRMDNRPELKRALAAVGKGDALVVYSLSRLARSTRDALAISDLLSRKKADLVSLSESLDTTTAAGKMIFQVLAVLAEFERNLTAERTAAALDYKRRKGEKYSPVPFGFDEAEGKRLVANQEEADILETVLKMKGAGKSLGEIARELNGQGITGKQGGRLYRSSVSYWLRRLEADLSTG